MCLALAVDALPQTLIAHPWHGKRVAYFGDSITDPRNSGSKKKYWGFLQDWLQIEPLVYGVSGRQWNDIPRQTDQLKQQHGQDFDAILEYGHGQPKTMVTRRQRTPSMDPTTLKGRMNIALDSLKRTFPTKQIVLLTPIHRSDFHANEKNWQCDESYTNQCGEYIDAYINAVKEAADVWAVPVIDWSASCGLFPMVKEHQQYFKGEADLLHPNDDGHQRMARTLMYQLLALPCTF